MGRTQIGGRQVLDKSIQYVDIDTETPGQSLITRVAAGAGIDISSTGADEGTGVVTINSKTYIHSQLSAVSTWIIGHFLNKYPSVTVYDSTVEKRVVVGDVEYVDTNTVKVTFSFPFAGEAYLN